MKSGKRARLNRFPLAHTCCCSSEYGLLLPVTTMSVTTSSEPRIFEADRIFIGEAYKHSESSVNKILKKKFIARSEFFCGHLTILGEGACYANLAKKPFLPAWNLILEGSLNIAKKKSFVSSGYEALFAICSLAKLFLWEGRSHAWLIPWPQPTSCRCRSPAGGQSGYREIAG